MKEIIAVSGKGGTGKTAISALLIKLLSERDNPSILAIDADADSNLPEALGVTVERTVGDIREGILDLPSDTIQKRYDPRMEFDGKIMEIIKEEDDYDLLVMGRPEGPGCYCPVNHTIRLVIDTLSKSYDYTIIDCEAGLEHFSRRTTGGVDIMIVVTDATVKGLQTAVRIKKIANEIGVDVAKIVGIANKIPEEMNSLLMEEAKKYGVELVGIIPIDPLIAEYDMIGKPIIELPDDSPAVVGVKNIIEKVL
jgi:CO dehydrogenase maturation factor